MNLVDKLADAFAYGLAIGCIVCITPIVLVIGAYSTYELAMMIFG